MTQVYTMEMFNEGLAIYPGSTENLVMGDVKIALPESPQKTHLFIFTWWGDNIFGLVESLSGERIDRLTGLYDTTCLFDAAEAVYLYLEGMTPEGEE